MGPPNPPGATRRPFTVHDRRGNCIHVGSVVAPSDADGLRAVLSGPPPCALEAAEHYRVRVGTAVASSAGDEFARTACNTGLSEEDGADLERREHDEREAKRVRAEAEGALKGFLKDQLAARERERGSSGRELVDALHAAADGLRHPDLDADGGAGHLLPAADSYSYSIGPGGHGGGSVFSGAPCDFSRPGPLEVEADPAGSWVRFSETRRCPRCGDRKIGIRAHRGVRPASLVREARERIDDEFRTARFPCPAGRVHAGTGTAGASGNGTRVAGYSPIAGRPGHWGPVAGRGAPD